MPPAGAPTLRARRKRKRGASGRWATRGRGGGGVRIVQPARDKNGRKESALNDPDPQALPPSLKHNLGIQTRGHQEGLVRLRELGVAEGHCLGEIFFFYGAGYRLSLNSSYFLAR